MRVYSSCANRTTSKARRRVSEASAAGPLTSAERPRPRRVSCSSCQKSVFGLRGHQAENHTCVRLAGDVRDPPRIADNPRGLNRNKGQRGEKKIRLTRRCRLPEYRPPQCQPVHCMTFALEHARGRRHRAVDGEQAEVGRAGGRLEGQLCGSGDFHVASGRDLDRGCEFRDLHFQLLDAHQGLLKAEIETSAGRRTAGTELPSGGRFSAKWQLRHVPDYHRMARLSKEILVVVGRSLAHLEDGQEGFLRDIDFADAFHAALAFLLLFEQLALAR